MAQSLRDKFAGLTDNDDTMSKRANNYYGSQVPGFNEYCLHGGPPPSEVSASGAHAATVQCLFAVVELNNQSILEARRRSLNPHDTKDLITRQELNYLMEFWRPRMHMVTPTTWKMVLSSGVDACANADHNIARYNVRIASMLLGLADHGWDGWYRIITTERYPPELKRHLRWMAQTQTDLGLILFFKDQIPCHCFDTLAHLALQKPQQRKCAYCGLQDDHTKILSCKSCKSVAYCSTDHQAADWPSHKPFCLFIKRHRRESS
mmetsp:Transcript_30663/g.93718  ORF Transcript_30663/g.93718 Transcript_30663/m.93718 type:complete len:263 (-) Transcript_30663:101-889(-)|eukprot:CAMPEP_0198664458 /NCGR_PEP_ID=MMETSP1467-20131203/56319_1 /TAXON_ID=1462469 /ORGANISM="unid. sp., Strain CCMP2135" /LENGTH=262 /DNA_ID=CAMNT_0044401025 /DNA_START=44 /DNA_END=832 /DNA_ORIENTATION=-